MQRTSLRIAAALGAGLLLLGGCEGTDDQPAPESPTATVEPGQDANDPPEQETDGERTEGEGTGEGDRAGADDGPAHDVAVAEGSGCAPGTDELPDGRWYGEVVDAGTDSLELDLMCFFIGEEADKAAAEDGRAEVPVPNDYYVRNDNPALRTVPVAGGAQVRHYVDASPDDPRTISYTEWGGLVAAEGVLLHVWLTVQDGQVVTVEEQWVP